MLTKANTGERDWGLLKYPTHLHIAKGYIEKFSFELLYLTISVSLAALVVAVVVPPVPRGRVEARLRS